METKHESPISLSEAQLVPATARDRLLQLLMTKDASKALPRVTPRPAHSLAPLSLSQEKIWRFEKENRDHRTYQLFFAYRVTGEIDLLVLEGAIARLVKRHEVLRTTIIEEGTSAWQRIAEDAPTRVEFLDLSFYDAYERDRRAHTLIAQSMQSKPDIFSAGPILNAGLIRLSTEEHILTINCHHLAADATSMQLMTQELGVHYSALLNGRPSPLPTLNLQYGDYAHWQREHLEGKELKRQTNYWLSRLSDVVESTELPLDRSRPLDGLRGAGRVYSQVPALLWDHSMALSKKHKTTPFTLVLAVTHLFIYAVSQQRDQLIGVIASKKPDDDLAFVLGDFHNVTPMLGHIDPSLSFVEWLSLVRSTVLSASGNQDVPFGQLAEALGWSDKIGAKQLPRILYTYINAPTVTSDNPSFVIRPIPLEDGYMTRNDLRINCHEHQSGATIIFHYAKDLFDKSTIQGFATRYHQLFEAVIREPDEKIENLVMRSL